MNLKKNLLYLTIPFLLGSVPIKSLEAQTTFKNPLETIFPKQNYLDIFSNSTDYDSLGFSFSEKLTYFTQGGSQEMAKEYDKVTNSPRENLLNFIAGIPPEKVGKFQDTKLPNALLIYSNWDTSGVLISEADIMMLKTIKNNYDISLNICSNDSEISRVLDKIENPDLIMFVGHGKEDVIKLSEDMKITRDIINGYIIGNEHLLDTTDTEIFDKLAKKGDATCVFFSCLSGKVLAPYIKSKAPNLKIYASTESFNDLEFKINSIYPFDISFFDGKKDCTYYE